MALSCQTSQQAIRRPADVRRQAGLRQKLVIQARIGTKSYVWLISDLCKSLACEDSISCALSLNG